MKKAAEGEEEEEEGADETVTRGSGNVFADLQVANPQEALAKAELVSAISSIMRKRGLSQTQAARITKVDQPMLSKLLRGRTRNFTIDRLVEMLTLKSVGGTPPLARMVRAEQEEGSDPSPLP
jgi:predicted XRE-type DNA-binding protein